MFALASAALVLLALLVGLAGAIRAKAGHRWAPAGLAAGVACWIAPIIQQFTRRTGNLTALLNHQSTGRYTGPAFSLKTLTAFTEPPPLWWLPLHPRQRLALARIIDGRPAVFAVVILVLITAVIPAAVLRLRSRPLASLAGLSVLACAAALVTFASIPVEGNSLRFLSYLTIVMFPVGLLVWLTAAAALVLMGRPVIGRFHLPAGGQAEPRGEQAGPRREQAGPRGRQREPPRAWTRWAVPVTAAATAPLVVLASLPAVTQLRPALAGDAPLVRAVTIYSQLIEQALPREPIALSVVGANRHYRHRLTVALMWALRGDGYRPWHGSPPAGRQVLKVTVLLHSSRITVNAPTAGMNLPTA